MWAGSTQGNPREEQLYQTGSKKNEEYWGMYNTQLGKEIFPRKLYRGREILFRRQTREKKFTTEEGTSSEVGEFPRERQI